MGTESITSGEFDLRCGTRDKISSPVFFPMKKINFAFVNKEIGNFLERFKFYI